MVWSRPGVLALLFLGLLSSCESPAIGSRWTIDVPEQEEYISVHFNKESDGSDKPGYFEEILLYYISGAQQSIDLAMFTAEAHELSTALNDAVKRGVRIRYITSGDQQANLALPTLDHSIPVVYGSADFSMHHKYYIIDAHTEDATVITSSANNAEWDLRQQSNNMVILKDRDLALAYERDFEQMWGGSQDLPDRANARFGWQKQPSPKRNFLVDGIPVEVYFNPVDSSNVRLIELMDSSQQEIYLAQMLFFGDELGSAMVDALQRDVKVQGVLKEYYTRFHLCEFWIVEPAGADILVDTVPRGIHHKYAIFDPLSESATVTTGSYNWHSDSIAIDDNMLVIHSREIAQKYLEDFQMHYDRSARVPEYEVRKTRFLAKRFPAQQAQ